MDQNYKTVLLFGPPGVGKGTQGHILKHVPGFFHVSTGEIFRNLDIESDIGKVFYQYSSRGELVPDDVTIKIWHQHVYANTILGLYKPRQDILVLDGLPRSVNQAKMLFRYIDVLKIVHLVCKDKEQLFERILKRAMKSNRVDDAKHDVIRRRWEVYENETYPVLSYYPPELVVEIDAMQSPAVVVGAVLDVVAPLQSKHFENPLGK